LYDQPITRDLLDAISRLPQDLVEQAKLSPDRAPEVLARLLHDRLYHSLAALKGKDRSELQLDLTNQILKLLATNIGEGGAGAGDEVAAPAEVLRAILAEPTGVLAVPEAPERPKIALSNSELLTNGPNDVSVGPEIRRELASADRVDLLCSFLKWHGLRVIDEPLREFLTRNPDGLRVLTTTYIGATERRALDALSEMGAKIRISYDTGRTRLHAKAWLFHRNSGFSTAYVGSSNLSATAMLDGLEWNVRLSQTDNGPILRKFETAFEQYWSDSQFESYQHGRDAERFDRAIRDERRGKGREDADGTAVLPAIDLTARPHQQEILDDLAAERESGHTRNLVVAATGTGKTVVSALDYRRLAKSMGTSDNRQPSLLFVAHRDEILRQSQATFRLALRDGRFGERLVAGEVPTDGRHVFASIQSLTESRLNDLAPDAYDIVIIDEFHHAAAPSYDRLLKHLRPKVLLGLTATPERTDGKPILHHFDDRIASELRLWRALDQGLLSPFQYFGLHGPDVSFVKWVRGRYDSTALSNVYTADHAFALRVVQEVQQKVTDIKSMKALGFCVDVAHANFMATQFAKAGVHATAISGGTPRTERRHTGAL
jgi:HKD family nuclease